MLSSCYAADTTRAYWPGRTGVRHVADVEQVGRLGADREVGSAVLQDRRIRNCQLPMYASHHFIDKQVPTLSLCNSMFGKYRSRPCLLGVGVLCAVVPGWRLWLLHMHAGLTNMWQSTGPDQAPCLMSFFNQGLGN